MSANKVYEQAVTIVKAIREHQGVTNSFIPKKTIVNCIVPCPLCKEGWMNYTISSYNGHRSAECSEHCFGYYVE